MTTTNEPLKMEQTYRVKAKTSHAYQVEIGTGWNDYVIVFADTRTQAASYVRKRGGNVRSVNMIG
jgi:hypothetical protein